MHSTRRDKEVGSYQYIDTSADVQQEPSSIPVSAGVANLRVLYPSKGLNLPVDLTIQTSTKLHRGVHMSRLVHAATVKRAKSVEEWLRAICSEVNRTQPGTEVTCRMELPRSDQFAKMTVHGTESGALTYRFEVMGITACPCSRKMIGIGHMQRAEITLMLRNKKPLNSHAVIAKVEECFSAMPTEKMKRVEEAKKILDAQEHPRFAEDLVRECVGRFPNALFVSSRCFESIHAHDAVATWSAKPGWMPAFA